MSEDKRGRFYTKVNTPYGEVEVTVQASEGEPIESLENVLERRLEHAVEQQSQLIKKEDKTHGVE